MIKFGTSGFRAIMSENFTKENVKKVAYALCEIIKEEGEKKPIIHLGFDNRFMGEFYARWVSEVFAYNKIKVIFYQHSTPTPVIAFMSKSNTLGIVLTASHNPYYYNGIKVLKNGGDISDDFAKKVEKIANSVKKVDYQDFDEAVKAKHIIFAPDAIDYENSILSFLSKTKIAKRSPKILFNSMHGNSVEYIRSICSKLKLKNYEIMNSSVDPYFEHNLPAPYLQNLTKQRDRVVAEKFDLGLALDGDSDRITCISDKGEIYDCNYILPLLYNYLYEVKNFRGGVIRNTAFSNLIKYVADSNNEESYTSKVGFKHIAELFYNTNAFIGAETNGVAIKKHLYNKDGILAGFLLIDMICHHQKQLSEILETLQAKFSYPSKVYEFSYPITEKKKAEIQNKVFIEKQVPKFKRKLENIIYPDGAKFIFEKGYWCMIRFSGNENVVRLFTELEDDESCNKMFALLERFIGVKERQ